MVYSTLDNWDGSMGSGQADNKRPRRSASSPPTELESAAEHSLPVQLTSIPSTRETGLFVHTGLLAGSPTLSKTMARPSAQDQPNIATKTILHDLRASNTDLLSLQESDDEMQVDSTLNYRNATARFPRQARPTRQPLFVPGSSSPPTFADGFSTPPEALFKPPSSPSPARNYETNPSPSKSVQDIFTPSSPLSERARSIQIGTKQRSGTRLIIDYIAVPPLPHGLGKSDYIKPRAKKAFVKKPAVKVITAKKPFFLKQPDINPLVEAFNRAAAHNSLPAYSRKGKERAIDSDADSDGDYEYGSIIHVSRPLKRKDQVLDRDDTGSISVGPRPKKKQKPQADKPSNIVSSSSYLPSDIASTPILNKDLSNASRTHTKPGPREIPRRDITISPSKVSQNTRRVARDAGLPKCNIEPQESYELEAYPRACGVSLRHIRAVFQESGGREKLWAARYDVGDERVYTRLAPVPPPESARSPPKARKKPGRKPRVLALGAAAPSMRSTYVSAFTQKSNNDSQHSRTLRNEKELPIAGTSSDIGSSQIAAMILDYGSTSADAEGETDLEYFNEHVGGALGEDKAARPTNISSQMTTALPSSFMGASNQLRPTHTSSATLPPASSSSTCSSEEPVHNLHSNDITINRSQPDSQVLSRRADLPTASPPLAEISITPWLAENLAYAGNGTIDPSLLGGAHLSPNPSPSPSPGPTHFQEIIITEEPYNSPNSPMHEDEDFLVTWPTQPASPVDLPKRTRRRVVRADMVPIDSVLSGSDSSSDSDTSVQSSVDLQYPASDAGPVSHGIASAGPSSNFTVSNGSTSTSSTSSQDASHLPHGPSTVQERPSQNNDLVPESFCHQCRRRTKRPKMKCRGKKINSRGAPCKFEYCDYCVQRRYPQLKFDKTNAKFECPKCSGYCNCTACARQRGEVYNGPRTAQANSDVQRLDKSQPRTKNVRNLPPAPANPTRYWGTVYHNVTGERVSAAYAGSDDKDPRVVMPRFTSTKGALLARAHGQHVFVGKVQDSWRVNYRRVKGGTRGSAIGRVYIGRKPPTQRPVYVDEGEEGEEDFDRPRSSSPISGAESDLTPLPDTPPHWLEPEEGEFLSYGLAPEVTEEVTKKALEALLGSIPPPL